VPASNFDNFTNAILTVFVVLANDGWTPIYWDHYRVVSKLGSTIYFHFLVIFGQWILFNLFLAILLKEFDERSLLQDSEDPVEEKVKKPTLRKRFCKCCCGGKKEVPGVPLEPAIKESGETFAEGHD